MLPLPPRRITSDQETEDRVKTVRVRCDFNRILEIDLQKQTFTAALIATGLRPALWSSDPRICRATGAGEVEGGPI